MRRFSRLLIVWGVIGPVICFFWARGYDVRFDVIANIRIMRLWVGDIEMPFVDVVALGLGLIGLGLSLSPRALGRTLGETLEKQN